MPTTKETFTFRTEDARKFASVRITHSMTSPANRNTDPSAVFTATSRLRPVLVIGPFSLL